MAIICVIMQHPLNANMLLLPIYNLLKIMFYFFIALLYFGTIQTCHGPVVTKILPDQVIFFLKNNFIITSVDKYVCTS